VYLKDRLSLFKASSFVLYDRQALSLVWRVLQKPCIRVGRAHPRRTAHIGRLLSSISWFSFMNNNTLRMGQHQKAGPHVGTMGPPSGNAPLQGYYPTCTPPPLLTPFYLPFNNHYMFCTKPNLTELSPRKLTGGQKGGQLLK